jgi:hypothetical protein
MKSFILAATVAAGLLCSASTADAQFRRSRVTYSYPSYSYSYPSYSYSYPSYSYPAYSYAAPSYYDSGVVVTSGYTPMYSSGSYYSTPFYGSSYDTPFYGNSYYNGYYNGGYYNGYSNGYYNNGLNITPSGVNFGGRRIWRW